MQTFDSISSEGRRQIVEAYRAAVLSSPERLSFKCFCDTNGISNYKAILWWCRECLAAGYLAVTLAIESGRSAEVVVVLVVLVGFVGEDLIVPEVVGGVVDGGGEELDVFEIPPGHRAAVAHLVDGAVVDVVHDEGEGVAFDVEDHRWVGVGYEALEHVCRFIEGGPILPYAVEVDSVFVVELKP